MICGSRGSKSRLAKATGAEPSGEMRDEKLRAVVARSTFGSQNAKNTSCSSTFGSSDVEKVHAVAAQNTFPSQNVHHTPASEHFWKLRCAKRARRCFRSQKCKKMVVSERFLRLGCGFAWQAQGILHLPKREQNARVL